MSMQDNFTKAVIDDFEKLLEIAEESSGKIDHLLQVREKQKIRFVYIFSMAYAFSIVTFFIFNNIFHGAVKDLYFVTIIAIMLVGSFFILFKNYFFMKKISRDLRIERNIHETLISMLDVQKQRLYEIDTLSSVSHAIYEIRLKRLDRTDKNIY